MSIENARPFDPNNRPLKGEWIHISAESETATMPSLEQGVDASLTQGHDVVKRETSAKQGSKIWMYVAIALIVIVISLVVVISRGKLSKGTFGSTSSESSPSISESSKSDSQSLGDDAQAKTGESDASKPEVSKGDSEGESSPSGPQ